MSTLLVLAARGGSARPVSARPLRARAAEVAWWLARGALHSALWLSYVERAARNARFGTDFPIMLGRNSDRPVFFHALRAAVVRCLNAFRAGSGDEDLTIDWSSENRVEQLDLCNRLEQ